VEAAGDVTCGAQLLGVVAPHGSLRRRQGKTPVFSADSVELVPRSVALRDVAHVLSRNLSPGNSRTVRHAETVWIFLVTALVPAVP
jgi:hypothetical protein